MRPVDIRLAEFGSTFATRERASRIAAEVVARLPVGQERLVFDFAGVRLVSYSFADELLKQAASILLGSGVHEVTFSNCNEEVLVVFRSTVEKRGRFADSGLVTSTHQHSLAIGMA